MQENKVTIMITGDNINLITEMKKKKKTWGIRKNMKTGMGECEDKGLFPLSAVSLDSLCCAVLRDHINSQGWSPPPPSRGQAFH
jgi:hypothetical protein